MVDTVNHAGGRRLDRCGAGARKPMARAVVLVLGLLATALAGCGSGDDVASKTPAAILAASRTAARAASAVHVTSRIFASAIKTKDNAATKPVLVSTVELQLTHEGGRARIVLRGSESEAIRIGNTLYVKGGPLFYRNLQRRTGAHITPGTWLKVPANGAQLTDYAALTQPSGELMLLLRDPTLSLTKGTTTTIDGHNAIELKTEGKLYTGAIYIAATGTPYPIEIVKHGHESGQVTFTGWNDPATLLAPTNAITLSQLQHEAH